MKRDISWRGLLAVFCCWLLVCSVMWSAVDFDGVDDLLNCGSLANLDNMNPISLAITMKIDALPPAGQVVVLIAKDAVIWRFHLFDTGAVRMRFPHTVATLTRLSVASTAATGVWNVWIVTWDGTVNETGVSIYKDGTAVSYAAGASGSGAQSDDAALDLVIGNDPGLTQDLDGQVTEVAVWEATLSANEISRVSLPRRSRIPLHVRPADLRLYIPMDEFADGVTATGTGAFRDLSGNGNHCTPSNSPVGRAQPLGIQGVAWMRSPVTTPWALAARVVW